MEMERQWAFWRRVQYGSGLGVIVLLIVGTIYFSFFHNAASCFDGRQNGGERGIDCGGSCVRICSTDVEPLAVLWARSFRVSEGQYNAVAYVENRNLTAASPEVRYTFSLYDSRGLIAERVGTTVLPPNSVYPILEARIGTGDRVPTQTFITVDPPSLWLPAESGRDQFSVVDRQLFGADERPRLEATIRNDGLTEARDVDVVATIFDARGNALTSSATFIERFAPRSEERVVFTWPEPIANTLRSCEVPSDIMMVLDRSGSMAADGGSPPEPLESAKRAAETFVNQLRSDDQVGYFSYATMPSSPIEQTLTLSKGTLINSIRSTVMGRNGVQYTNMGEAFKVALAELQARGRTGARDVIVFLTDGDVTRPVNPTTGAADRAYAAGYARAEAEKVKAEGVTVFTIGLGELFAEDNPEVSRDVELIRDLATDPAHYYRAPSVTDLSGVYRLIAESICEDGPSIIDIVPKTATSFAPLQ